MKWSILRSIFPLWFTCLLFQICATASLSCSGNQITWVTKNNVFIKCSPCPPCFPGQQYSISCKFTAVEGTVATCINCPRGTYSQSFDTKPCRPCKICSKRRYLQNCTPYRNAKCGECKSGYFKDPVVFGCVECSKCCHDGHDVSAPGCKEVGMCKYSSKSCPTKSTTTAPTKNSTTPPPKNTIHPIPKTSVRRNGWLGRTTGWKTSSPNKTDSTPSDKGYLSDGEHSPTPTPSTHSTRPQQVTPKAQVSKNPQPLKDRQSKGADEKGSDYSVGFYVFLALFIMAFTGFGLGLWKYIKLKKENRRFRRSISSYSSPVSHHPPAMPDDMKLSDFMHNHTDVYDEVCTDLFEKTPGGSFYFDLIASKFPSLNTQDRQAIEATRHYEKNPAREMMESLCAYEPSLTVRQFASKVQLLNLARMKKVYKKLEQYFTVQEQACHDKSS